MRLLQVVVIQRRVLQWLVLLVSLWVGIVFGFAFSGALVAQAEDNGPLPALSSEKARARFRTYSLPLSLERNAVDTALPQEQPDVEVIAFPSVVIDGDSGPPIGDLLPARTVRTSTEPRLFVDGNCQTPMSLMLHSSFGPKRMQQLAREILARGLKTTTYREVAEGLRRGECPGSYSIVVSLDDFGTDWLRPHFQSMMNIFSERGLKLVVAVNVHGSQDPDAWAYLREFEALDNEVANHTIDHYNLARLDPDQVGWQVKGAHQIICHNLGRCPETLILPFGINDGNGTVRSAADGYSFIVGIPGGRAFGGEAPYYLGRIGPDNTDQLSTLNELAVTFDSKLTAGAEFLSFRAKIGRGCAAGPSSYIAIPLSVCSPSAARSLTPARGQTLPATP